MRPHKYILAIVSFIIGISLNLFWLPSSVVQGQDLDAPTISNVSISELSTTSVTVTWKTSEEADAQINFGLDERYGIARDPTLGTRNHAIFIDDLVPATTYHYQVISSDEEGNKSIAGGYRFRTQVSTTDEVIPPDVDIDELLKEIARLKKLIEELSKNQKELPLAVKILDNPRILEIGLDYAIISWKTDLPSNSVVSIASELEYNPASDNRYSFQQGLINDLVVDHFVRLIGLQSGTTYHIGARSESPDGFVGESGDVEFRTRSIVPEVYSLRTDKVEEEAVTLTWTTNVPTEALVEFTDVRTSEKKSQGSPILTTSHRLRLDSLIFGRKYSAIVKARDSKGVEGVSVPIIFTTTKDELPPVISQVTNESTLFPGSENRVQTLIGWQTDELSICQFFYSQGLSDTDAESFDLEVGYVLAHTQVVTSFAPATVYKFWVTCEDQRGNEARSEDFVLFTPEREKSIIDLILENFESTFGWVKNIIPSS